jgi:hypothetical protein
MQTGAALVFLCAAAISAPAAWIERTSRNESSPVAELVHRQVELEDSETGDRASVEFALFSTKTFKLRLIDNAAGAASLAEAMPRSNCLAGVNGGYFDPNFAPIGLRIIDGKPARPLVRARLLTGVLFSGADFIQILRVGEYSKSRRNPYSAIQCGPLLVDQGRRVAGLDRTRVARRTFAVIGTGDRAALGFCSEVSLAEIAQILASTGLGDNIKTQRALNLDGGSSSAFWFKRNSGAFSIPEEKPVRDFVGIVAKKD